MWKILKKLKQNFTKMETSITFKNNKEAIAYNKLSTRLEALENSYDQRQFERVIKLAPGIIKDFTALLRNKAAIPIFDAYCLYVRACKQENQFTKALDICLNGWLKLVKENWNDQTNQYAVCVSDIGEIYLRLGVYDKAEIFVEQALEINKKLKGENSDCYCLSLEKRAEIKANTSLPDAIKMMNDVIILTQSEHLLPMFYMTLSDLYCKLGDYKYLIFLQKVCALHYKNANKLQECIDVCGCLGLNYMKIKDLENGNKILRETKEIAIENYGNNYPHVTSFNEIMHNYTHLIAHDSSCTDCNIVNSGDAFYNYDHGIKYCANCHIINAKMDICGGCKEVCYCSKDCQKIHWKLHKLSCKLFKK